MVTVACQWKGCGKHFQARQADINRGWGKFCSKSCKAKEQESRTGQYSAHQARENDINESFRNGIDPFLHPYSDDAFNGLG